jgi:predicted amidohydrolase YtcJ
MTADVLLTNAVVYTCDEARTTASAVAIRADTILYVGDDEGSLAQLRGTQTKVLDVGGRAIVPGIVDAHTHPSFVVLTQWHVSLPVTRDLIEIFEFLREYAQEHPVSAVPFIYAEYYDSGLDWGPDGPTAAMIDRYVSDRPVLMQDSSDHASTVNSRMLELLGVDASTPLIVNPDDHAQRFVRGADWVTPTGHVLEGAWGAYAERMWQHIGWAPPSEVTPELLESFIRMLSDKGVTAVFDAITGPDGLASAAALDAQGKLNMYFHGATLFTSVVDLPDSIARLRTLQQEHGSDRIHVNTMKLFLDGTNEIGTSSVLEPYVLAGHEHDHGVLRVSAADLGLAMRRLNDEDIDLHIHVVGDRGFRTALDAVESVKAESGDAWKIQVTLAHAELVDPADMPRVAQLGVYVNWTCHWSGGYFGLASAQWLGWDRYLRMYQFNPIIESGGIINYGSDVVSDYEAARANPYFGMQVAHTRVDPQSPMDPGPGTVPGTAARQTLNARMSLSDLVQGYTRHGAMQLRILAWTGSIEADKRANLAVLNQDPFKVAEDEIQHTDPDIVIFEGRVIKGSIDPNQARNES